MEKKKLMRSKPAFSVEEQERALAMLNQKAEKTPTTQPQQKNTSAPVQAKTQPKTIIEKPTRVVYEKSMYSYNVKLDEVTEGRIKALISQTGQNMKGFFQIAIREYLDRHEA